MASDKEVAVDLSPILITYTDGTVNRLLTSPFLPPSPDPDSTTGVSSKDILISSYISARLYLPNPTNQSKKLPILIYFHGGGFCIGSAFTNTEHNYLNSIVSQSNSLAVSVEYRLAPEHPLPTAYEDCWDALNWVASHCTELSTNKDLWLVTYGDFDRLYIGGDSAGGNIVHNIAMRAGNESLNGGVKIVGGFLSHPHFWGSEAIGNEPSDNREESMPSRIWRFVYPTAPGGDDDPAVNPWAKNATSLAGIGCRRLLVVVAEKDVLRERGIRYNATVKDSGWEGEVELVEFEGEDHCFHLFNPGTENAKKMIKSLASFIM